MFELESHNNQKELIKFSVEYYNNFSIISDIDCDDISFLYFPNRNEVLNLNSFPIDSSLFNTLEELSDPNNKEELDYYLVTEPLIRFTVVSNLSLDNKYNDGFEDLEEHIIYGIYSDIKDSEELYNFDNYRKSLFYVTSVIEYIWSYGFDDSDCEVCYLGLIDNILESALIKPSRDRIKVDKIEEGENRDDMYNEMSESSF